MDALIRLLVGARPRSTMCCRLTTGSARVLWKTAARFHGARNKFTFHAGMGHAPTDAAPDVRSRSTPSKPMWRSAMMAPRVC